MQVCLRYFCLALAAIVASSLEADPVKIITVDGRTIQGNVTQWSSEKVVIASESETSSLVSDELLAINLGNLVKSRDEDQSPLWIELSDNTRIPFSNLEVRDRMAIISTPLTGDNHKIPASRIRSVQFTPAGQAAIAKSSSQQTGDFLAIVGKDPSETETLQGVIGKVTSEQVEFTWDGETIPVKLSKIAALGFHQAVLAEKSDPLCVVVLDSGAALHAREVSLQGADLEVKTVDGMQLEVPLSMVVKVDYSAGKISYLSDMEPLRSKWTPLVSLPSAATIIKDFGHPRRDISFMGSPLTLSSKNKSDSEVTLETYDKGLALRSRTELEYRIPKDALRFVAKAGIDPETAAQGHVLLRVEIDGQTVFEKEIAGGENPVDIDVDVEGSQRLKITVDYGENLDTGDRLHLVEARLVK